MSRCLTTTAIFFLAAATLAWPLAAAVDPVSAPFTVAATPEARDAFPGENVTYGVRVTNTGLIERSMTTAVVSQLPADWTWSFSPDEFLLASGANATSTLTVFIPANAAPQQLTIVYEAKDSLGEWQRGNVTVTVHARPAAEETRTVAPPVLSLRTSVGDTGESGTVVRGALTLQNDDPSRPAFTATIALAGADGWRAYVNSSDATRVLHYGLPVVIPLYAEIPQLTQDAEKDLTITVTVEGWTYLAHWDVRGTAPDAAEGAQATEDATEETTTTPRQGASPARGPLTPSGPNLEVLVVPLEIRIPANGQTDAVVRLSNTGNTPLTIALLGTPPPTWRPIEFDTRALTLAPGANAEVPITLFAPDVPPGGRAQGSITAQADNGLVRGADFVITVLPAAPRDTTTAAAIEAPASPDGALPAVGTTVLVVAGLAAVGGSAALLVNRPLREGLLWGAAGLYTRLARPDVLGHEDREKLYRLVETQPGIHFHALQRDLGWNTGTLTYHLRVLEKHGFMVSRRDGLYRRFYLSGAAPRKEVFENQGPTGLRADVMEAIRNQPGISQSDLALGLGANKQTVNYHVKALERAGTIRVEKRGRDTFLYAAEPTTAPSGPGMARV